MVDNAPRPTTTVIGSGGRAIVPWAVAGLAFLVIQMVVYGRWIMSDQFRPTAVGPDLIPTISLYGVRIYEGLSLLTLVIVILWFVSGWRKNGDIDNLRLLMLGWLSAYWLDPWLNFLRPMFTYNAYMFNRGCWCEFMPFWQSPNGSRIAEPLLVDPPAYFYSFAATAWSALLVMRWVRRRWPNAGNVALGIAASCSIWLTMGLLDIFATKVLHFDAWPGAFRSTSFWGGTFYQFPIYEFVLFPSTFVACAFLVFYARADGTTAIESGLGQVGFGRTKTGRTMLRVLAFVAFANVCNLAYTTALGVHALYVDPWPQMPSWLANEQCDGNTGVKCSLPRPTPIKHGRTP